MMQKNAMDALPDLEKAVALGPQLAMTHVALGEALQVLYRNDEALRTLDRALAIEPKNFSALMLRSRTHYYLGHYDLALADNMAALPLASGDVALLAAYEARVDIRLAQGENDTAITDARTAVAKLPKSASAQAIIGAVYANQGLTREAMVEFGKAIAMEATPYSYLTRAGIRPKGDLAGRRADIAAAIKLDPATPETQEMVLAVELQLGDYDQVISTASKLLVNEPKNMQLLTERGIAYASTGRQRLAEQDFAAVRAVIGANVGVLNSLCQEKAVENVALSSAIDDCAAGLKLEAESPQLLNSRGFVLLRMARYQDAVDSYDRALSIRPNMAEALFGRGLAKRRLGRTAEGNADIAAAKMLSGRIEERYAGYGVTN
jgi:tetratricopeptide (TPR) repeat protein